MFLDPIYFPSFHLSPSPVTTPFPNNTKFKRKIWRKDEKNKKGKELKISLRKLQCDPESHALYLFVHTSVLASVRCKESSIWFEAPGPPPYVWCWVANQTLPGCPAGALCCGDPAAFRLWVRSLHMLQKIVHGVDVVPGQVITLDVGLDSCRVVLPDEKWGWLYRGHNFQAGSPTPVQTVLSLLSFPGEVQGLLSQVLQLLEVMDGSHTLMTSGSFLHLPLALMGGWWGQGEHFSPARFATREMGDEDSSSMVTVSGLALPHLHKQCWFNCAALARCWACSPEFFSWWG